MLRLGELLHHHLPLLSLDPGLLLLLDLAFVVSHLLLLIDNGLLQVIDLPLFLFGRAWLGQVIFLFFCLVHKLSKKKKKGGHLLRGLAGKGPKEDAGANLVCVDHPVIHQTLHNILYGLRNF